MRGIPLYPKPKERYERFRLNPESPLYGSSLFLHLSDRARSTSSLFRENGLFGLSSTPTGFTPRIDYVGDIGRDAVYFPGLNTQKLLFTPSSGYANQSSTVSVFSLWKFDGSTQDGYTHLGGQWGNYYLWARNINFSSWGFLVARSTGTQQLRTHATFSDFSQASNWNAVGAVFLPYTYPILFHNGVQYQENSSVTASLQPAKISLGAYELGSGDYEIKGWIADFCVFSGALPAAWILQLSEISNVDLRVGGVPLIIPERPRFWGVAVAGDSVQHRTPWHLLIQGAH